MSQVTVAAAEYHLDRDASPLVTFYSEAPLEDFEGVTDLVDGYVSWVGEELTEEGAYDTSEFYFEVELDGLDTGLNLRNRHMRENHLETDKFPYATYDGRIISVRNSVADTLLVAVAGALSLHGRERPLETTLTVVPNASGYRVAGQFEIRLTDYEIKIPGIMFFKVSETVRLEIDFALQPATKN